MIMSRADLGLKIQDRWDQLMGSFRNSDASAIQSLALAPQTAAPDITTKGAAAELPQVSLNTGSPAFNGQSPAMFEGAVALSTIANTELPNNYQGQLDQASLNPGSVISGVYNPNYQQRPSAEEGPSTSIQQLSGSTATLNLEQGTPEERWLKKKNDEIA